uniref:Uncharacterized protein n=1 Tax=Ananas comosus var. bracteatus TaxID=296719 RepID=A0A6V7PDP2_ANACO|nr:unnamed protein product [Ananas comosus var. bracteatus]
MLGAIRCVFDTTSLFVPSLLASPTSSPAKKNPTHSPPLHHLVSLLSAPPPSPTSPKSMAISSPRPRQDNLLLGKLVHGALPSRFRRLRLLHLQAPRRPRYRWISSLLEQDFEVLCDISRHLRMAGYVPNICRVPFDFE